MRLAAIRLGQVTPAAEAALCRRLERNGAALPTGAGVEPTALFPYRHEVAALNAERVGRLPGDAVRYVAVDGGVQWPHFDAKSPPSDLTPPSQGCSTWRWLPLHLWGEGHKS